MDPASRTDILLVALADGPSATTAATEILQEVARAQQRTIVVTDLRAPSAGDSRGLSSTGALWILGAWAFGGVVVAIFPAALRDGRRRGPRPEPVTAPM